VEDDARSLSLLARRRCVGLPWNQLPRRAAGAYLKKRQKSLHRDGDGKRPLTCVWRHCRKVTYQDHGAIAGRSPSTSWDSRPCCQVDASQAGYAASEITIVAAVKILGSFLQSGQNAPRFSCAPSLKSPLCRCFRKRHCAMA
jgi:hypothetical protein